VFHRLSSHPNDQIIYSTDHFTKALGNDIIDTMYSSNNTALEADDTACNRSIGYLFNSLDHTQWQKMADIIGSAAG